MTTLTPGRPRGAIAAATLVGGLLTCGPAAALAGDALRERTPVVHRGETCLTVVDRGATPVVHLEYGFPVEDTCAGSYPAPTHQFIALCRPPAPGEALPQWISSADIDAAEALEIPLFPISADDILADSPAWSGCWSRVTADADRRPLTCEVALAGVDWDVSTLAPGTYVIAGYTFHAPRHRWSPRWGVFKIADADPDDAPPVAALAQREAFVYADQQLDLAVCVSAMPGSTLRIEYAIDGNAPTWLPLAELAVTGPVVSTPWTPPPAVHGEDVRLRVHVDDPLGRHGKLEAPELLHVLAVPSPTSGDGGDEPTDEAGDACRSPTPIEQPYCPPPPDPVEDSADEADEPAPGCSCTQGASWSAWLLLIGLRRRRLRCR